LKTARVHETTQHPVADCGGLSSEYRTCLILFSDFLTWVW